MNNYEKIQKIANTYGYDVQSRQCIEEMAEQWGGRVNANT